MTHWGLDGRIFAGRRHFEEGRRSLLVLDVPSKLNSFFEHKY
jgi:hypothetical protein